jgi:carboxymethylenebutenolidase
MILRSDETADILVEGTESTMRLHMFRPVAGGRYPGIVLFSEIYQVTAPIRRLAATVAGLGYVVAVPEVYHDHLAAGTVLAYDPAGTDVGNALKFSKPVAAFDADARAALAFLGRHPACTGKLGTLGVCLGGHLALRAAMNPAAAAAACFYATDVHSSTLGSGQHDDSLARFADLRSQMLFVWGRQDPHVPFEGRQTIRTALEAAKVDYRWHEVDAQHAFLRDEGPRFDPALYVWSLNLLNEFFGSALRPTGE